MNNDKELRLSIVMLDNQVVLNSGTEVVRLIKSLNETEIHIGFYFGLQLTNSYINVFKR